MSVNSYGPIDREGATAQDDQTIGLVTRNLAVARNMGDLRQHALDTTPQEKIITSALSDGKDPFGNLHIRFFDPLFTEAIKPGIPEASLTDMVESKSQVWTSFNGRKKRHPQETNEQIMARTMFAGFAQGTFTFGAMTQDDSGIAGDLRAGESIFWRAPETEMGNPGDLIQWQLRLATREEIEQRKAVLPESNEYPPNRLTCEYKIFKPWRDVPELMSKVVNSALGGDQNGFDAIVGTDKMNKYYSADNLPQDENEQAAAIAAGTLSTELPFAHEVYTSHVVATSVAALAGAIAFQQQNGGAVDKVQTVSFANSLGLNAKGTAGNPSALRKLMLIADFGWLSPENREKNKADDIRTILGAPGADARKIVCSAGRQQMASFVTAYRMEQSRIIAQLTGNAYSGRLASIIR